MINKKFIVLLVVLSLLFAGCNKKPAILPGEDPSTNPNGTNVVVDPTEDPTPTEPDVNPVSPGNNTGTVVDPNTSQGGDSSPTEHPKAPELTWLNEFQIPEYAGKPYVTINDNIPFFDLDTLVPESYEVYYDLDELGRCTLADAVVGRDLMPTTKRGDIGSVKPTGWHSDKYSFVDGESLYNRCHLIAHYLTAENANPYNLVTGTRYMNDDGMNAVENMVGDFIKDTNYHVRYRVTVVWTDDNLICDGLLVEAYSIEDEGEGVCLCFYTYNVQPGVVIDYKTGDNYAMEGWDPKKDAPEKTPEYEKYLTEEDIVGTYICNTKKNKFHLPECEGATGMSEKNKMEYTGSRNELVKQGYVPCSECNP